MRRDVWGRWQVFLFVGGVVYGGGYALWATMHTAVLDALFDLVMGRLWLALSWAVVSFGLIWRQNIIQSNSTVEDSS
ncbi:MAG TPA: hypothetical protein PLD25_12965 [Chloroflexota bacterium]|nr:hypothetical protein [Chloroflexota bacterium]HUM70764.1 hypothetical protein [Chloroflexota bacterium]